ncbi:MAG: Bug family tripartite tricarboxylate transporter substrate binding protein [Hyphomicrobiaceae bacterium]
MELIMNPKVPGRTVTGLAAICLACVTQPTRAEAAEPFPTRPVKIVTQAAAGSALDVLTRIVADRLSKTWTAGVVVENRPGAGGALAAGAVTSAVKDGHTLLHAAASIYTILPAEAAKPAIDPDRDLVPVAHMGDLPLVIAVPKASRITTLAALISEAKTSPGKLNVGTNGAGSFPWLAASLLIEKTGASMTIVPYARGGAPAILNDLLGERLHLTVEAISGLKGALDSGQLRALAVTSASRLPGFKEVPTVAETTPGFTAIGWSILAAPAGTPDAIVAEIDKATSAAMADPLVKERLANLGVFPRAMAPAELRTFIAGEQRIWWPLVKAQGQR